jgi:4-amino-4-deoxy-L-arabinose transferase-like glycosyltransferase
MPRSGMSLPEFIAGYALAAGYGYVEGHGRSYDHLRGLYDKASVGFNITPETAGPLPSEGVRPWMLHPPGFSLLVAGLPRLLGTNPDGAVALIGLVLDVAAVGLVWWMAAALMGSRVGLAAGLVYALYPPYAYWSTVSKSVDGMLAPFIAGMLACIVQAILPSTFCWLIAIGYVLARGWRRQDPDDPLRRTV